TSACAPVRWSAPRSWSATTCWPSPVEKVMRPEATSTVSSTLALPMTTSPTGVGWTVRVVPIRSRWMPSPASARSGARVEFQTRSPDFASATRGPARWRIPCASSPPLAGAAATRGAATTATRRTPRATRTGTMPRALPSGPRYTLSSKDFAGETWRFPRSRRARQALSQRDGACGARGIDVAVVSRIAVLLLAAVSMALAMPFSTADPPVTPPSLGSGEPGDEGCINLMTANWGGPLLVYPYLAEDVIGVAFQEDVGSGMTLGAFIIPSLCNLPVQPPSYEQVNSTGSALENMVSFPLI